MNRLIGISIIRNEENNYLKPWLKNMTNFLDYHVFLDDASDDNTPEIIQQAIDRGYPGEIHLRQASLFKQNEPKLRAELWEYVRKVAKEGDWILIVDADEFYDERLLDLKPKLFSLSTERYDCVKVSILDMWDKTKYRADGLWSPKNSDVRIIRFYDVPFGQSSTSLHQPPYPTKINIKKRFKTYIPKFHMAYLKEADRKRRYDFYKENVSRESDPALYAHALSIMEITPTLKKHLSLWHQIKHYFGGRKIDVFEGI